MSGRRMIFAALAVAALTACDNRLAPGMRKSNRIILGDFVVPVASVHTPDTLSAFDTIHVSFDVVQGEDPCSFATFSDVRMTRIVYLAPYGVNRHGATCKPREMLVPLFRKGPTRFEPDSIDPITMRVVVCQTYQPPIVRDVVLLPNPKTIVRPGRADESAMRVNERECATILSHVPDAGGSSE